ncbi:MAG: efflux RND transporter periplasmic adaptor subunit [Segetibacter sp.]|jgi:HlyD family secretion protein|nr:efflux RND transporter periplasmic adaptor subunit [Segetibacter sp.]
MKRFIWLLILATGCQSHDRKFDASGVFEADEVIVSSEISGRIQQLNVTEGDTISKGKIGAVINAENIVLQKEQVEASISALQQKTNDVAPQVQLLQNQLAVQQSQLTNLQKERKRFENLVKADAATPKQLDDIIAQMDVATKQMNVTRQQIKVQQTNTSTANRSILSEKAPLEKRIAQLNDQVKRANVINPINGTVLTKYAEAGEITAAGKPLYKVADLSTVTLRAYITGDQVSQVKLNQPVKVLVDNGAKNYKSYNGVISWISDKAEFTPKTIQTKDERANLVYAVKIRVVNDGYLKLGMYGEVNFK